MFSLNIFKKKKTFENLQNNILSHLTNLSKKNTIWRNSVQIMVNVYKMKVNDLCGTSYKFKQVWNL